MKYMLAPHTLFVRSTAKTHTHAWISGNFQGGIELAFFPPSS